MTGIIVVSDYWTRALSFGRAEAIMLFPFVFVRNASAKSDKRLLNHEAIHVRQALEMLIIPFYLWYLLEFVYHLAKQKDFGKAYRHISFEKEAYANEGNPSYLKTRKFWDFSPYLRK